MNARTAKMLRSQCLDKYGNVDKGRARYLKKWWNSLLKKEKSKKRIKK